MILMLVDIGRRNRRGCGGVGGVVINRKRGGEGKESTIFGSSIKRLSSALPVKVLLVDSVIGQSGHSCFSPIKEPPITEIPRDRLNLPFF